ncbi:MAG: patatin-like phospholipase family protein [Alphaproteobacteria bacterium]|nr:patatin-like phospholipase family protein [Alphaproteobacteria bacterium]
MAFETIDRDVSDTRKHAPGIGLALGGGMARGFVHIGVLNVLNRHGIIPSVVAGTSIGAVVAGSYLAGKLSDLQDWSLSLNRMKIISYLDFRMRSGGLIGGNKLQILLDRYFKDIMIEDLPQPLITVATDLRTGHEVWLRKGSLIDAMKASFALPGVFPPVMRNHRLLADGALVNPLPIAACQAMGARMTIAVDLNADIIGKASKTGDNYQAAAGLDMLNEMEAPKEPSYFGDSWLTRKVLRREENSPSLFGVMVSALGIMQDRLTRARIAGDPPDIHIKPQIGHIGLLEFDKASELIAEGERAAVKALPEIRDAMRVFLPPNE